MDALYLPTDDVALYTLGKILNFQVIFPAIPRSLPFYANFLLQQSFDQYEVFGPEKGRINQNRTDRNIIHVLRRSKSKIDST